MKNLKHCISCGWTGEEGHLTYCNEGLDERHRIYCPDCNSDEVKDEQEKA